MAEMKEQIKLVAQRIQALREVEGLTEEEQAERAVLRRAYIDSFKESLVGQLENTYIVDEKGNKTKVTRKGKK